MRKIAIFESNWDKNKQTYIKKQINEGIFLEFGVDSREGLGSYSIALVEMADGTVKGIKLKDIKFIS